MTIDISITLSAKDERNQNLIRRLAAAELKRQRALPERPDGGADFSLRLLKRSLDARHGRQKVHLRLRASI
ncbi:MAG: hypothetical protein K2H09_02705, partial [Treponemataceae bacterium]|nr:hypothetical protein [Treponemataceae bacterium]